MRVLLDHCLPKRFRRLLPGHEIRTAYEMGWSGLSNGALLRTASAEFDAVITVDQNVEFQLSREQFVLPLIILCAPNNRFETLIPYASTLLKLLSEEIKSGPIRVMPNQQVVRD